MAKKKATGATEWNKPDLVTLPSGKAAHLRDKFNLYAALRAHVLTQDMLEDYQAVQRGELQDPARAMAIQDAMVRWLFVEPCCHVGEGAAPEGAIHINDLDDDDLDFLIARALGGAPEEGGFPPSDAAPGDAGDAGAGADREAVVDEPKPAARPRARKSSSSSNRPPPRRASGTSRGSKSRSRAK
jgi:hypothetical protein